MPGGDLFCQFDIMQCMCVHSMISHSTVTQCVSSTGAQRCELPTAEVVGVTQTSYSTSEVQWKHGFHTVMSHNMHQIPPHYHYLNQYCHLITSPSSPLHGHQYHRHHQYTSTIVVTSVITITSSITTHVYTVAFIPCRIEWFVSS